MIHFVHAFEKKRLNFKGFLQTPGDQQVNKNVRAVPLFFRPFEKVPLTAVST
jgi:hypothetical protein